MAFPLEEELTALPHCQCTSIAWNHRDAHALCWSSDSLPILHDEATLIIEQILSLVSNIQGYSRRNQVSVLDQTVLDSSVLPPPTSTARPRSTAAAPDFVTLSAASTLIQPTGDALAAATIAAESRAAALIAATQVPRLAVRAIEDSEGDIILEDCDYYPNTSVSLSVNPEYTLLT